MTVEEIKNSFTLNPIIVKSEVNTIIYDLNIVN